MVCHLQAPPLRLVDRLRQQQQQQQHQQQQQQAAATPVSSADLPSSSSSQAEALLAAATASSSQADIFGTSAVASPALRAEAHRSYLLAKAGQAESRRLSHVTAGSSQQPGLAPPQLLGMSAPSNTQQQDVQQPQPPAVVAATVLEGMRHSAVPLSDAVQQQDQARQLGNVEVMFGQARLRAIEAASAHNTQQAASTRSGQLGLVTSDTGTGSSSQQLGQLSAPLNERHAQDAPAAAPQEQEAAAGPTPVLPRHQEVLLLQQPALREQQVPTPQQTADLLQQQAHVPEQQSAISAQQAATPEQQAILPEQQADEQQQQEVAAEQQAVVSEQQAALSAQQDVLSQPQVVVPEQPVVVPEQQADMPQRRAVVLEQQAVVPDQQAHQPQQQAGMPEQQAIMPQQQAVVPRQRVLLPQQRALVPQQRQAAVLVNDEPMAFEELVGLRGPIRLLFENAGTVIFSSAMFMAATLWAPFTAGRITIRGIVTAQAAWKLTVLPAAAMQLLLKNYQVSYLSPDLAWPIIHSSRGVQKLLRCYLQGPLLESWSIFNALSAELGPDFVASVSGVCLTGHCCLKLQILGFGPKLHQADVASSEAKCPVWVLQAYSSRLAMMLQGCRHLLKRCIRYARRTHHSGSPGLFMPCNKPGAM